MWPETSVWVVVMPMGGIGVDCLLSLVLQIELTRQPLLAAHVICACQVLAQLDVKVAANHSVSGSPDGIR